MKIVTIDIGTNTVLALEAETEGPGGGDRLARRRDTIDIVRLGEGLDRSGRLAEAAMERALAVLARHGRAIAAERPEHAAAIATEAVRAAANGDQFLRRAKEALGFEVEVIGGEREAHLSWLATMRSLPPPPAG